MGWNWQLLASCLLGSITVTLENCQSECWKWPRYLEVPVGIATMAIGTLSLEIFITDLDFAKRRLASPTICHCELRYFIVNGMLVGAKKALVQGMFAGNVCMAFASATTHGFSLDIMHGIRHSL